MALEQLTQQLLEECFRGRHCSRCGRPATRLARKQFFCAWHFTLSRSNGVEDRRVHRYPRFAGPRR
jgi:hypothetical protein